MARSLNMKNMPLLFLLLITIISTQQSATYSQLTLTILSEMPKQACKVNIHNSHQILDIQTNCRNQSKSTTYQQMIELINLKASYLIKIGADKFEGYRYFKLPNHYKFGEYNFTLHKNVLAGLFQSNGINLTLEFQDRYEIQIYYDVEKDSWIVQSIQIKYMFNPIPQVSELTNYNLSYVLKNSTSSSSSKDIFLTRKLTGKGLHQSVNITLYLDLISQELILSNTCSFHIEQVLPESTYIDYDQLRTVNKYETIDVQKPQHYSKQYFYQYGINLNKFTRNQMRTYSYSYPMHFRYPKPSELNYTIVALHPSDQMFISCNNGTNKLLFQEQLFANRGAASIFTGSSRDSRLVSIITFILMIMGAMVIIKKLKRQ